MARTPGTWFVALTEAEDELIIELTLPDGREIGWIIDDFGMPEVVTEVDDSREVPVAEIAVTSLKHLRELLKGKTQ